MRILLQRVKEASVTVGGKSTGEAGPGLLALVGFENSDREKLLVPMIEKMLNLRVFSDSEGKMNLSLMDIEGDLVLVSQFTLYADSKKGRRPSFVKALEPEQANLLFDQTVKLCKSRVRNVFQGVFGAEMNVQLINNGPVTILLDSKELGINP